MMTTIRLCHDDYFSAGRLPNISLEIYDYLVGGGGEVRGDGRWLCALLGSPFGLG